MKEKKVKINEMKNIQDIFMDKLSLFTGTKTNFIWKFIMGNVYIFSPFSKYSGHLAQFFNVIIQAYKWLMQCKIPVDFLFLDVY